MSMKDTLKREPVRKYLYSVAAAVVALLVFYGVLTAAAVPLILGLAVALLALPSPVEALRNKVSPVLDEGDSPPETVPGNAERSIR